MSEDQRSSERARVEGGAEERPEPSSTQGRASPLISSLLRGVAERSAEVLGASVGDELRRELEAKGLSAELVVRALEERVQKSNKGAEGPEPRETRKRALPKSPSELVERVGSKVEAYRAEGLEIARAELRRFLDRIDLNQELQALLAQFSVEVKTEIRFAPSEDGSGVKPVVKTSAQVKRDPEGKTGEG